MADTEEKAIDTRLSPLAAELADLPRAEEEAALRPSGERYLNREVSWLDFNARVLAQAEQADLPLLERAKFLAIFANNLDEFFQVRIAGLKDQVAADVGVPSPDGAPRASSCRRCARRSWAWSSATWPPTRR